MTTTDFETVLKTIYEQKKEKNVWKGQKLSGFEDSLFNFFLNILI